MKVGFAGATHLGWCMAAGAAEKGFDCVMMEHDKEAFKKCDLVFFTQDVSVGADGYGDMDEIRAAFDNMLINCSDNAIVVNMAQVRPGMTAEMGMNANVAGRIRELYYQVETLIYGKSFNRVAHPERFIVGSGYVNNDGYIIHPLYREFLSAWHCPIYVMSHRSAEMAKLAINMFLASSISTARVLKNICLKSDADWMDIEQAMRSDSRIGQDAYIRPGDWKESKHLVRDITTLRDMCFTYNLPEMFFDALEQA